MEQWKQIVYKNVEYNYEVSTKDGKVRNMKTGHILKQFVDSEGYLYTRLRRNNKREHIRIHRLVATMFIPNPDNLPLVDHIDRNRQNNSVENLRWVTHKTNSDNRDNESRQKKRVRCVETGQIFESLTEACQILGLHESNLSYCLSGKYKTCGGFHWEFVEEK